jgi:D-arabinitol 4-dehydrogenase
MTNTAEQPFVMLHLGVGSFHRAHQALYIHKLQESGDLSWQLAGGNIRADMADTMSALAKQNGEYTLETITPAGVHDFTRVKSISQVIPFEPKLTALIAVAAKPTTRIISFTVTEAGYYLDAKNVLDTSITFTRQDNLRCVNCYVAAAYVV